MWPQPNINACTGSAIRCQLTVYSLVPLTRLQRTRLVLIQDVSFQLTLSVVCTTHAVPIIDALSQYYCKRRKAPYNADAVQDL